MAFLTEVSAGRYFRFRHPAAGDGMSGVRLRRSAVAAVKDACDFAAALAVIAAVMTALALFELWIWFPHLPR